MGSEMCIRDRSFTFHNVSINTENPDVSGVDFQNFTFHDVSINTLRHILMIVFSFFFTFHDVSINTEIGSGQSKETLLALHSTMFLLIQFQS